MMKSKQTIFAFFFAPNALPSADAPLRNIKLKLETLAEYTQIQILSKLL